MKPFPSTNELVAYLSTRVVGQDEAVAKLASTIYQHFYSVQKEGAPRPKLNILLVGPTGSGKTFMVEKVAEALGVMVKIINAAALTPEGYEGRHFSDEMEELIRLAGSNTERAKNAVVVLDEIDKLRVRKSTNENLGGLVQQQLLPSLISSDVAGLATQNILFVATGAFVGLTDICRRRIDNLELAEEEAFKRTTPQDLSTFGLIPEFVGRFPVRIHLKPLKVEDFLRHIKTSKGAGIQKTIDFFADHGLELVVTEEALEAFAVHASKCGLGMRGLDSLVSDACAPIVPQFLQMREAGTTRIEITPEVITRGATPRVSRSSKRLSGNPADEVKRKLDEFHERISKSEPLKVEASKTAPPPRSAELMSEFPFPLFPAPAASPLTDAEKEALRKLTNPPPPTPSMWRRLARGALKVYTHCCQGWRWFQSNAFSSSVFFAALSYSIVIALGYGDDIHSLKDALDVAIARYHCDVWHLAALSLAIIAFAVRRYGPAQKVLLAICMGHLGVLAYATVVILAARADLFPLRDTTLFRLRCEDYLLMREGYGSVWNFLGMAIALYFTMGVLSPQPGASDYFPSSFAHVLRRWSRGAGEEEQFK